MANFINSVLIDRYKSGNTYSFETLFLRHKQRIFNYINSKVIDIDVSNDIFWFKKPTKILNKAKNGSYQEEGKFLPWVMRISHNLVIDHFRKNNRIPIFESKDEFDIFLLKKIILSLMIIIFHQIEMIDQLPKSQKQIVKLRFYENLTFKEIAEINKIAIGPPIIIPIVPVKNIARAFHPSPKNCFVNHMLNVIITKVFCRIFRVINICF